MNYLTLYYQYVIVDTRFFELDVPLEVGLGNYVYNLKDETNNLFCKIDIELQVDLKRDHNFTCELYCPVRDSISVENSYG